MLRFLMIEAYVVVNAVVLMIVIHFIARTAIDGLCALVVAAIKQYFFSKKEVFIELAKLEDEGEEERFQTRTN